METVGLTLMASKPSRRVAAAFWAGKRVLLTGHTGFKGAWAALWLRELGATVTGFALLPPTSPSLFALAGVEQDLDSVIGDLRHESEVAGAVARADPQIVLHFAAQPLVRASFAAPAETFAVNVMGTVHLLAALRPCASLETVLVVTTDKVYANAETGEAFAESDRLGGHDPYAASKTAAEIATTSFAASFFEAKGVRVATARGGNVIGGGDFSPDRIVPDVWRALSNGETLKLRYPDATRPWQHVLDCLAGYFLYAERLSRDVAAPRALNFGPVPDAPVTVASLVDAMQAALGATLGWERDVAQQPREMRQLALDSRLARDTLDWQDRLPGRAAIAATAAWYKAFAEGGDIRALTLDAIRDYARE